MKALRAPLRLQLRGLLALAFGGGQMPSPAVAQNAFQRRQDGRTRLFRGLPLKAMARAMVPRRGFPVACLGVAHTAVLRKSELGSRRRGKPNSPIAVERGDCAVEQ